MSKAVQLSSGQESQAAVRRQEFGATQEQSVAETQALAVAAQAKAAIEARYILALQRPRNWETVRVSLEKECSRPSFAAVARYRKPVGRGIEGPSIRFAEAALRCMTNVYPETQVIYESDEKRIVQVCVTDLEANLSYSTQIVINKTVERRKLKDGQKAISQRENSQGEITYLVSATEDDLLNKQNALISKALRTNALRLLPGDILDRCMQIVKATKMDAAAQDPDTEKRNLVDAFADKGVAPNNLEMFLEHPLEQVQPAELVELRDIYTAIRDGETTWKEVMDAKNPSGSVEAAHDVAQEKLAALRKKGKQKPKQADKPTAVEDPQPLTEEEMKAQTAESDAAPQRKMAFPKRGEK